MVYNTFVKIINKFTAKFTNSRLKNPKDVLYLFDFYKVLIDL